jgi:hypothetical protein
MPPVAGTPARLSAASACRAVPEMTDRATPDRWRDHLIEQFSTLLVDFDPAAVLAATDGYYLADPALGTPLLVTLGGGAVLAYAACGGMSFKFAPLVARALADRALGRTPRRTGLDSVDRPRQFAAGDTVAAAAEPTKGEPTKGEPPKSGPARGGSTRTGPTRTGPAGAAAGTRISDRRRSRGSAG